VPFQLNSFSSSRSPYKDGLTKIRIPDPKFPDLLLNIYFGVGVDTSREFKINFGQEPFVYDLYSRTIPKTDEKSTVLFIVVLILLGNGILVFDVFRSQLVRNILSIGLTILSLKILTRFWWN